MTTVRLATFNCENLFARYRFEGKPPGGSRDVLTPAELQQHWGFKPPQSWVNSFQVFSHDGWREVTALALKGVDGYPDIACFQEIEDLPTLRLFNQEFLGKYFGYAMCIESHDPRNIDIGVLSRYPIIDLKSHVDDRVPGGAANQFVFSRDCLEVTVDVNGNMLTIFLNHLKSQLAKSPAEEASGNQRRLAQSTAVANIVRARFGDPEWKSQNLVVAGDFNDQPTSPYVKPLLGMGFENVVDRLPANERWTHYWSAKSLVAQLDYLLLSPSLAQKSPKAPYIERRGLIKKQHMKAFMGTLDDQKGAEVPLPANRFNGVTNTISASDHCPVVMELSL